MIKRNIAIILMLMLPSVFYGQKFAIISDIHGASSNTLDVSNLVKGWSPDFIITSGDNFYPLQDSIDNQVGQFYHEYISPYYGVYGNGDSINSFFPALGNHDYDLGNINAFLAYFTLSGNERYYDFVKGNIHFFAINSIANEPDGTADTSIQAHWLKDKLAHSTSIYNIVYFHYPPYSSGMHGSAVQMQWPFKQWGATAVFSGHDHDYERLIIDSFPYFVNGLGGGTTYTVFNNPGSQIHYNYKHGAILAKANSDSISFDFINVSDSIVDHFAILNKQTTVYDGFYKNNFDIIQNYPNPCSKNSVIKFYLSKSCKVRIKVCDILGKEIELLSDKQMKSGINEVIWNTSELKSGVYFYNLYYDNCLKGTGKAIIENKE